MRRCQIRIVGLSPISTSGALTVRLPVLILPVLALLPLLHLLVTVPKKCFDKPLGWFDSDGDTYDCAWDATGNRCTTDGDDHENLDTTANEACCVCGGGHMLAHPNPNCNDNPSDWHDSDGPFYDCDWYSHGQRCDLYGDDPKYKNFDKTAKEARCACFVESDN